MAIERVCVCVCASMWRSPSRFASIWCGGGDGAVVWMVENTMPGNSMKNTHNLPSNTNRNLSVCVCVCMRINYTASILFPFVGLIFGKHSAEFSIPLLCFAIHLYIFFVDTTYSLLYRPIFISSDSANQTICRNTFEWTNFECGTLHDYYFQDILQMFIVSSAKAWECKEHYGSVAGTTPIAYRFLQTNSVFNQFDGWLLQFSHGNSTVQNIPTCAECEESNSETLAHKKYDFHFPVDF